MIKEFQKGKIKFTSITELNENELLEILSWRNDINIRKWMNNANIISKTEHLNFVDSLRTNKYSTYWLTQRKEKPTGVVYLHISKDNSKNAEWGFYLAPHFLGSGVGLEIGFESIHFFFKCAGINFLHGYTKKDNFENLRLQSLYGFEEIEDDSTENIHLLLNKKKYNDLPEDYLKFQKNYFMKEKVNKIIIQILSNNSKEIPTTLLKPSLKLREDLGLDSFNLAELTVHIEEEFGIDIFEDGLINSIGEIYAKLKLPE